MASSTTINVLVTGASRGIGAATALKLAEEGYSVTLAARSLEKLEEVKSKLPVVNEGQKHHIWQLDLGDIAAATEFRGAPLPPSSYDVFFSNAGIATFATLVDTPDPDTEDMFKVNLLSPIALTKALVRANIDRKRERPFHIVYNSSIVALRGLPAVAIYSSTKGGLDSFMRTIARELGPKGFYVNSVNPGMTKTDGTSSLDLAAFGELPLPGWIEPRAIAEAVLFLIRSKNITGTTLVVDNGYTV